MVLACNLLCQAQDTIIFKSMYAASYLVVPENKEWKVEKAFVNGNDAYSIKINNNNFKEKYFAGDTLRAPYYIAEMELLTNKESVLYQLYIIQSNKK